MKAALQMIFFLLLLFQFDKDYLEFKNQVTALYESLQEFVDSWFEKSVTVSKVTNANPCFWCSEGLSTHSSY